MGGAREGGRTRAHLVAVRVDLLEHRAEERVVAGVRVDLLRDCPEALLVYQPAAEHVEAAENVDESGEVPAVCAHGCALSKALSGGHPWDICQPRERRARAGACASPLGAYVRWPES